MMIPESVDMIISGKGDMMISVLHIYSIQYTSVHIYSTHMYVEYGWNLKYIIPLYKSVFHDPCMQQCKDTKVVLHVLKCEQ